MKSASVPNPVGEWVGFKCQPPRLRPGKTVKTYLTVYFSSEGAKPSSVTEQLLGLGFKPTKGPHDYYYQWGEAQDVNDLIWFADRVHHALQGMNVMYKLETVG